MKRLLFLLPFLFILCTGCGSYVEIEDLIIVAGAAIDYDSADGRYTVTAEVIDLQDSGANDAGYQTVYLRSTGDSVAEAVADLSRIAGHELYWNHADVFLLGRGVLGSSVLPVLDWLMGDVNARLSALVVAAGTERAADVYQLTSPVRKSVSLSLEQILRSYHKVGNGSAVTVNDLVNRCRSVGSAVCMPMVTAEQNGDTPLLVVRSYAVLRGDTLAGICDGREAVGLQLLLGRPVRELLNVELPDGTSVLFRVGEVSTSLCVGVDGDTPGADVTVRAEIFSVSGETDLSSSDLRDGVAAKITDLCEAVLERDVTDFHADILGVGREISRRRPETWERLKADWTETYGKLQYSIHPVIRLEQLPEGRR